MREMISNIALFSQPVPVLPRFLCCPANSLRHWRKLYNGRHADKTLAVVLKTDRAHLLNWLYYRTLTVQGHLLVTLHGAGNNIKITDFFTLNIIVWIWQALYSAKPSCIVRGIYTCRNNYLARTHRFSFVVIFYGAVTLFVEEYSKAPYV
jgi:hypothetical protein